MSVSNADAQHTLEHLRSTVNDLTVFTQLEECVTFLQGIQLEKVFLIVSGSLGQSLVPRIHAMTQIDAIFIFCIDEIRHEEWVKEWTKVKGVFTRIEFISKALAKAAKQCDQDCAAVSFPSIDANDASKINLNQLEPSFMYSQLFKNTLLNMEHDRKTAVPALVKYCQQVYEDNPAQLALVNEFGRDYQPEQAVWWYTRDGFTYQMLNRALRLLEADIIVNMGFFIHDLHQRIQQLRQEQVEEYGGQPFVVYRGQGLPTTDFEELQKNQGGLMSFNCFLSTSTEKEASIEFAEAAALKKDKVGILYVMTIDPNIASIPFANIQKLSYYAKEAEILFSMHTLFRIGTIKREAHGRPYFEVTLSVTKDNDTQLNTLREQLSGETQASNSWERMGRLLIQVGQSDKAEELYNTLLEQSSNPNDQARYYHHLGYIKKAQGHYKEALCSYERALHCYQESLPDNHPDLATTYNNIGGVYQDMGEYTKALSYYERALEIRQSSLPAIHPDLATSYNNIGGVYQDMGEYTKALSFYERALEIWQKSLPANHPHLATAYNNIGLLYHTMGEYSKALSFYEKGLAMNQKSLPDNHPGLATAYNNIGGVYQKMGEYTKALSYYERALEIRKKSLPTNHPDLATSYNNIGGVYRTMDEYSKALSSHERALEIWQKSLPASHPDLAIAYNNIGLVYKNMGEYSKALSSHERALEIRKNSLPTDHPDLATSYNNIGGVYQKMGEYSKALSFYERALEIRKKSLPVNHPDLALSYNNIGWVYQDMGEYAKALPFHEKDLAINQKSLPGNHPDLAASYYDIGLVYKNMGEYSKALSFYEKNLEINQKILPADHPHIKILLESMDFLKLNLNK